MMSSIIWAKKLRLLIWLSMLTATTAGARQIPAAAIIPGLSNLLGSNKDEENSKTKEAHDSQSMLSRHQQEGLRKLPPPPPPPRNRGHDDVTGARLANTKDNPDEGDTKAMDRNESFPDYPPHPQFWAPGPFETYGGLPPPPPVWMDPSTGWGVDQSAGDTHQLLQQAMARESRLLMEIENLTCAIASYRQRDDLHMRQLDVLTERVVDTEATAARERNEIIELRTNCTDLGRTIAILKDEVEEWAQKCGNLTLQHDQDEEKLQEMKALVKERTREVEDLAAIIETSRIEQELALDGWTKKKQRGFFAWLFGMVSPENDAQDRLKEAHEFARSTLLRALQTERESVEELENVLADLQQNNSAISEMVKSRDFIIEELNERVAVFEEDKQVLKAALRQLQKEMKDEAPKTQKLVDDLKEARDEISRLNSDIDAILSEHQNELSLLQDALAQKEAIITDTESNMTVIGTYVDKLEERLASFALARREIDAREKQRAEAEERLREVESERDRLHNQISDFESEHHELKTLLQDLVDERAQLQKERASLEKERESLVAGDRALKDTISSLEIDVDSLGNVLEEWKSRVAQLEKELEEQALQLQHGTERECVLQQELQEAIDALERKAAEDKPMVPELDNLARELPSRTSVIPPPPPPPPPFDDRSASGFVETAPSWSQARNPSETESGVVETGAREFGAEGYKFYDADESSDRTKEMDEIPESALDGAPNSSESQLLSDGVSSINNSGGSSFSDTHQIMDDSKSADEPENLESARGEDEWNQNTPHHLLERHQLEGGKDVEPREEDDAAHDDPKGLTAETPCEDESSELPRKSDSTEDKDGQLLNQFDLDEGGLKGDGVDIRQRVHPAVDKASSSTSPPTVRTPTRPPAPRKVPFRRIRKAFARATGFHGVFTPPSSKRRSKAPQTPPLA